jgi:2,3-bisphosphoglycerate-dependent phosphoglycerate mutase
MRILLVRHGLSKANRDKNVHKTMADHAIPLDDEGVEQAHAVGAWLQPYLEGWQKAAPSRRSAAKARSDRESLVSYIGKGSRPIVGDLPPAPLKIRMWISPYERTRGTARAIQETLGRNTLAGDKDTQELGDFPWFDTREHVLLAEQQFGLFDGILDEDLPKEFPVEYAHYKKCEDFEGKFWARMPLGESRLDVVQRVHQAFGTIHRDALKHQIDNVIIVAHGVTIRAFVMMWCHKSVEWFEAEKNPPNCSVRLIDHDGEDHGLVFEGFKNERRLASGEPLLGYDSRGR